MASLLLWLVMLHSPPSTCSSTPNQSKPSSDVSSAFVVAPSSCSSYGVECYEYYDQLDVLTNTEYAILVTCQITQEKGTNFLLVQSLKDVFYCDLINWYILFTPLCSYWGRTSTTYVQLPMWRCVRNDGLDHYSAIRCHQDSNASEPADLPHAAYHPAGHHQGYGRQRTIYWLCASGHQAYPHGIVHMGFL